MLEAMPPVAEPMRAVERATMLDVETALVRT
jgi:hypothetical protein